VMTTFFIFTVLDELVDCQVDPLSTQKIVGLLLS